MGKTRGIQIKHIPRAQVCIPIAKLSGMRGCGRGLDHRLGSLMRLIVILLKSSFVLCVC